jgi:hypothetical protein
VAVPPLAAPPDPAATLTVNELTPSGTVQLCGEPVSAKVTVHVRIEQVAIGSAPAAELHNTPDAAAPRQQVTTNAERTPTELTAASKNRGNHNGDLDTKRC